MEVHLSDVSKREEFRKQSVFDGVVIDKIYGEKEQGYKRALEILAERLGVK